MINDTYGHKKDKYFLGNRSFTFGEDDKVTLASLKSQNWTFVPNVKKRVNFYGISIKDRYD